MLKLLSSIHILRPLRYIFRNKSRSILTMSGICVGVLSVVLISTIGSSGTAEVNKSLVTMGIDSLMVQVNKYKSDVRLDQTDLTEINKIKGIKDAMPLMSSLTTAKLLTDENDCMTWGIDKKADSLISLSAKHGRLINNTDTASKKRVAVIDEAIAIKTYGRSNIVGKTVEIYLGGAYHEYEIVGVAKSGISTLQSMLSNIVPSFVYVPFTTMQQDTGRTSYDQIAVRLSSPKNSEKVVEQVSFTLDKNHQTNDAFDIYNLLSQKDQLEEMLNLVTLVLSLIAAISLAVSGISIMTAMLANVGERTREIGIKKSIGAKSSDICLEFIVESSLISLTGSFVGIALGVLLSYIGGAIFNIEVVLNETAMIGVLISSVVLGMIFGAYPAYKAAKLKPVDALAMR